MSIKKVAEIDAYPFGFVLELDPKEDNSDLDITHFLNYNYKTIIIIFELSHLIQLILWNKIKNCGCWV